MSVRQTPPEAAQTSRAATRPSVLGVAVLGTGSIGMRHLGVLRAMDGVRPIAVPVRPERVNELSGAGLATARDVEDAVHRGATL